MYVAEAACIPLLPKCPTALQSLAAASMYAKDVANNSRLFCTALLSTATSHAGSDTSVPRIIGIDGCAEIVAGGPYAAAHR